MLARSAGLVDRGACIDWLSQYPFEEEKLYPPLTALSVVGTRLEGNMIVVILRVTVNNGAQTMEEVSPASRAIAARGGVEAVRSAWHAGAPASSSG